MQHPPQKKASFSVHGASVGSVNQTHKSCISAVSKDTEAMKTEVITRKKKRLLEIRRAASWAFVSSSRCPDCSVMITFASFNHVIVQLWNWNLLTHSRKNAKRCTLRSGRPLFAWAAVVFPSRLLSVLQLVFLVFTSKTSSQSACSLPELTANQPLSRDINVQPHLVVEAALHTSTV